MAVNLTARQFTDENLLVDIAAILTETGMDAHLLELEISESVLMRDVEKALAILRALKALGIRIAIDDFGVGYSSLTQLFRMPFNEMKIDRSLVGRIIESKEASIMVDALVSLAHKLNLTVCAEGVENRATLEELGRFGADFAQGYFVSTPVPPAELPQIIAHWDNQQRQPAVKTR